jgi:adenine-specific DNA methylase
MIKKVHNPDVLTCIANLSSDEVFTPPPVVNQMLDTLPKELWSDEKVTFLDPVSKSGVFLREITKRLIDGLESKIPNLEKRIEHILHNQVFGIGITELTSLISRRSLYCSKYADGKYSIVQFDNEQGNIKYIESSHTWENGKCVYCGVNKNYDRDKDLESYAYSFIHTNNPNKFFNNMKFDVIIGNPPYQMNDGGAGASAIPLYHKFIQSSIKLNPRYLSMIIPSRWFAGGKGLDEFREEMLNDKRISYLNDFMNAKECFPGVSLGGGVCYFLWDKSHNGPCMVTNTKDGKQFSIERDLNEFDVFVRNNKSVSIVKKVLKRDFTSIENLVETRNPFGFPSSYRGSDSSSKGHLILHSSKGIGYVSVSQVSQGGKYIEKNKVMISKVTSEHAGEPDKTGRFRVLSTIKPLPKNHVCTDSYLILGPFDNEEDTSNFIAYMKTKFFRFLLLQGVTSINLSRTKFKFIPTLNDYNVNDILLYKIYDLSEEEINEIEETIKDYE